MQRYSVDVDPFLSHIMTGHYREEAGYGTLRRQGSRSWLFLLTLEGTGRCRHRDGEVLCGHGDAVLLRPMTMHEYGVAPGAPVWEFLWAHFHPRPHWSGFLDWPVEGPGLAMVSLGEALEPTADALARAHASGDEMLAMPALEEALVRCWRVAAPQGRVVRDERVRKVISLLSGDLRIQWPIPALADEVGLSPSRLSHLFQDEVGVSVRAYAERLRIDRARQLLEHTNLTVREVAAEVGFESEFYFSNRFRKLVGSSPTRWRGHPTRL